MIRVNYTNLNGEKIEPRVFGSGAITCTKCNAFNGLIPEYSREYSDNVTFYYRCRDCGFEILGHEFNDECADIEATLQALELADADAKRKTELADAANMVILAYIETNKRLAELQALSTTMELTQTCLDAQSASYSRISFVTHKLKAYGIELEVN